jgi:hypothetical protein
MPLRRDLLAFNRPDGGLDLYDPLLDRLTHLDAADARALAPRLATLHTPVDGAPLTKDLRARLEGALLLEGPVVATIRAQTWSARVAPLEVPALPSPTLDIERATELPPWVSAAWREPEAWRRAAEEHAAGTLTVLRGFIQPDAAQALAAEVAALPFTRLDTDRVSAFRARFGAEGADLPVGGEPNRARAEPSLSELGALLVSESFRALAGGVLGVALPPCVTGNVWRLTMGDGMRAHPDGPRYAGTFALGLNDGWRAADGGAIAFGEPHDGGFDVRGRWLPFLGDVCLFAPHARSWHIVEPPTRERLTITGWWVRPNGG